MKIDDKRCKLHIINKSIWHYIFMSGFENWINRLKNPGCEKFYFPFFEWICNDWNLFHIHTQELKPVNWEIIQLSNYIIGTRRSDEQQRIETIVRDSVKIISLADGRGKKPIRIINLSMQTYLREEIRPRGRDTGPPERFHVWHSA